VFLPVFWLWSAGGLQTGMVCRKKALEGPFSSGGMPIIGTLIYDFDRQSVTWLAAIQQAGIFVFHLISPMTNGTISSSSAAGWRRSRLSFGDRVIGLVAATGRVVFSKLSRLLNQEDALSAPCCAAISALRTRLRRALHGQPGQAGYCGKT
jgi:hypothetical protein